MYFNSIKCFMHDIIKSIFICKMSTYFRHISYRCQIHHTIQKNLICCSPGYIWGLAFCSHVEINCETSWFPLQGRFGPMSLFIEVHLLGQETVMYLRLLVINFATLLVCLLDFGTVRIVWTFFYFQFNRKMNCHEMKHNQDNT